VSSCLAIVNTVRSGGNAVHAVEVQFSLVEFEALARHELRAHTHSYLFARDVQTRGVAVSFRLFN
jgi:hypothetical protein